MSLPRRDQFAEWFKDQWESDHMNYLSIWERYSNYCPKYKDDEATFTPPEWLFLEKFHTIAVQSAIERNFHLLWDRVDSTEDSSLYDACDGHAYYWPQLMAKLLDEYKPVKPAADTREEELFFALKGNGYDPEAPYLSRREWCWWGQKD
jgi:hypothetical protein